MKIAFLLLLLISHASFRSAFEITTKNEISAGQYNANLNFIDLPIKAFNMTVGDLLQNFTFVLDSELTYSWLPSNKSTIAHTNNTYKCQDACEISDQVRSMDYKGTNVTGVLTTDFFDFDFGEGRFKMQFLDALVDLSILPNADGSIGIGPKSYGVKGEQGLIESLQKANIINLPIISLDYNRSQVRVGGEFEDYYKDRAHMEWIETLSESGQWELPIKSYKIKNTEVTGPITGIISTTSTNIVVPSSAYELYLNELEKKCKKLFNVHLDQTYLACNINYTVYIDENNYSEYYCDAYYYYDLFADIKIRFLNHTYTIPASNLVFTYDTGVKCMAVLRMVKREDNNNIWTLGLPMLKNHYVILDYENQKVGISGQEHLLASLLLLCLLLII